MYSSIGGLPSEYKWYDYDNLNVRQILISDIPAIERSAIQGRTVDTVSLLSTLTDLSTEKVWGLTEGDAIYILAYLRKSCYTESHLTLTWDCNATTVKNDRGTVFREYHNEEDGWLRRKKMSRVKCGTKNTNLVYANKYKYVTILPKWNQIKTPSKCHVPTLADLHMAEEFADSNEVLWKRFKRFSSVLACLNGADMYEKLDLFEYMYSASYVNEVRNFYKSSYHGIDLRYELLCTECGDEPKIVKRLGAHEVLPQISEKSVMNMQFNLLQAQNIHITEDTPIKKLLYWHSVYQKNAAERKQKEQAAKNKRR